MIHHPGASLNKMHPQNKNGSTWRCKQFLARNVSSTTLNMDAIIAKRLSVGKTFPLHGRKCNHDGFE
ncbi:hypothetical protein Pla52o_22940 [Novipirellula galeiformis]|uniref:Uncharacterized protein n=1 Tax=Novipirellula galeiformis TaxID=2528004 RepID=A0A5C6CLC9_9BACT|nr:hypothetical protein Pla52o_22940 [Novipirellula galeiformis]